MLPYAMRSGRGSFEAKKLLGGALEVRSKLSTSSKAVRTASGPQARPLLGPDGIPRTPLPPFEQNAVRGSKRLQKLPKASEKEEPAPPVSSFTLTKAQNQEWLRLVDAGTYPETPLAREVYANRIAYPDEILLTRVGMFYESYFEQAATVASLLGIRLTSKKFKRKSGKGLSETTQDGISSSTLSSFPFAGFPCHAAPTYFRRLLDQNRYFVVVEELEDKTAAKNDSKTRFISRKYTPGTMMSESWQPTDENRYLMAIALEDGPRSAGAGADVDDLRDRKVGMAYIDISTDRAMVTKTTTLGELEHELARVGPTEIVVRARGGTEATQVTGSNGDQEIRLKEILRLSGIYTTYTSGATDAILVKGMLPELESKAVELAQAHLSACLLQDMPTLLPPNHLSESQVMQIDASTLLGLEIRQSLRPTSGSIGRTGLHSSPVSRAGTLLSVIKRTLTPSGTRKLINTLCQPSAHLPTVQRRHDLVDAFFKRTHLREDLRDHLRAMSSKARGTASGNGGEISRTLQKYLGKQGKAPLVSSNGVADGRDLWDLKEVVEDIARLKVRIEVDLNEVSHAEGRGTESALRHLVAGMRDLSDLTTRISEAVVENALNKPSSFDEPAGEIAFAEDTPPAQLSIKDEKLAEESAKWWIDPAFTPELRSLHDVVEGLLADQGDMQRDLRTKLGAPSLELKLGVSGFHVHMMRRKGSMDLIAQSADLVPLTTSKSTQTFQYAPWTKLGVKIGEATKAIVEAQREAFEVLRAEICDRQDDLLTNAEILSEVDLTLGFAQVAEELRFVRPEMHDRFETKIVDGRHPTVEYGLLASPNPRNFVPNSLYMGPSKFLHLISGPNQGGKSTVLRQTAIIAILAQAGSFVPAESASLGVVDATFSRVGARDDLYQNKSTFTMEMSETAYILRRATKRSLVIMDEIGRGTTLLSGIAIAYATMDYVLRHIGCRTLFATHYHELADMLKDGEEGRSRDGVENWCTDIDEGDGRFSYAYKLRPGVNRQSHAIKVARQAGVPAYFLKTAEDVLQRLEQEKAVGDVL